MEKYNKKRIEKLKRHKKEYIIELLIIQLKINEKRSSIQNKALHFFFTHLAIQLNNISIEYFKELQGIVFSMPYTGTIVKEELWKPIQKTMYGIDSTTELTTKMINGILDVLTLAFGNQGIEVSFPNRWDLILKQMNKEGLVYEL